MSKFLRHAILTLLVAGAFLPFAAQAARTSIDWVNLSGTTYIQPNFPSGIDLLIFGSNRYINFNTVTGSSGYGFRDNAGVMEFKNSGGSWTGIGAGGSVAGATSTNPFMASYFVATSTTASQFPYASTTALGVSGTAYLSSLNTKSLLFVGTGGKVSQDTNFFWDDPTFCMSIGGAACANTYLTVSPTFNDPSTEKKGIYSNTTGTLTADNATDVLAIVGLWKPNQNGNHYTAQHGSGVYGLGTALGSSGTVDYTTGVVGVAGNEGAGTVTNASAFMAHTPINNAAGVVTNYYAFYDQGTCSSVTGIANCFGGTFAYNTGVGTTSPWGALSVTTSNTGNPQFVIASSTAVNFIVNKNGQVGVGTTTPSWAITTSNATLPQLALTDTTASSFPWTLRSISNTLYIATSTATATSTANPFTINPNGLVGINTGAPTVGQLVITQGGNALAGTALPGLYIQGSGVNNVGMTIDAQGGGHAMFLGGVSGGATPQGTFQFSDRTTLKQDLVVGPSGNVGVSTSTPNWLLTLATSTMPQLSLSDGTGASNAWTFRSVGNSLYIATSTDSSIGVVPATSTIPALTITPNGFVGIQTAAPVAQMTVGNSGNFAALSNTYSGSGAFTATRQALVLYDGTRRSVVEVIGASGLFLGTEDSTPINFLVGNATKMILDTSGRLLLGTSTGSISPLIVGSATNPQLALSDNNGSNIWTFRSAGNSLYIATSTAAATSTKSSLIINANGAVFLPSAAVSSGSQTGYWCYDANDQLIQDSAVCIAVSARRFKQDIQPFDAGLSELLRLHPVSYKLKPSYNTLFSNNPNYNGVQEGFIADDVQKIDPRLVTVETSTTTFEGKTYAPGAVHGLSDFSNWTAVIVSSIQDFYGQFQALVGRVSGLEAKVNAQQKQIDRLQAEIDALKH